MSDRFINIHEFIYTYEKIINWKERMYDSIWIHVSRRIDRIGHLEIVHISNLGDMLQFLNYWKYIKYQNKNILYLNYQKILLFNLVSYISINTYWFSDLSNQSSIKLWGTVWWDHWMIKTWNQCIFDYWSVFMISIAIAIEINHDGFHSSTPRRHRQWRARGDFFFLFWICPSPRWACARPRKSSLETTSTATCRSSQEPNPIGSFYTAETKNHTWHCTSAGKQTWQTQPDHWYFPAWIMIPGSSCSRELLRLDQNLVEPCENVKVSAVLQTPTSSGAWRVPGWGNLYNVDDTCGETTYACDWIDRCDYRKPMNHTLCKHRSGSGCYCLVVWRVGQFLMWEPEVGESVHFVAWELCLAYIQAVLWYARTICAECWFVIEKCDSGR